MIVVTYNSHPDLLPLIIGDPTRDREEGSFGFVISFFYCRSIR